MDKTLYYYITAGVTIGIAGLLHLVYAYNGISRGGVSLFTIFFVVAGIAQLFWVLPMVKRWGRKWYIVGIGGTIVLMIVYTMTRIPNPITNGRALSISGIGIATEVFQAAFIIITALIIFKERRIHASQIQELR
ncbi:MAG TPA: hypothetical protein VFD60_09230 [Nitrososphaeraceae archaeon]|jgi:hypothetical protein|nr:hypothetical protein [Nitrososphaeraceae archaeon]